MSRTTLVIPCYNEEHRLPVERYVAFAKQRADVRLLFVNDGSRDNTGGLLQGMARGAGLGNIGVLDLEKNVGKAEAVRRGMQKAMQEKDGQGKGAELVGYWDADLATPLEELEGFEALLREKAGVELVMGSRVAMLGRNIERKTYRHYVGRVFATCTSMALGLTVYDTQCGAKLFRSDEVLEEILKEPMCSRWLVDVELLFRMRRQWRKKYGCGCKKQSGGQKQPKPMGGGWEGTSGGWVYEQPLRMWRDVGESKVKTSDFFVSLWRLWRLKKQYAGCGREK